MIKFYFLPLEINNLLKDEVHIPAFRNFNNSSYFLTVSFIVSALFGFVMKFSKLFPNLDETYYKSLGPIRGMYHDGVSGLIVQITLILLNKFVRYV